MSKSAKQPVYHENKNKIKSREYVIKSYREITGLDSIPKDKQYWTFCREQPNSDGSEIVQLINSGLIQKSQFYGVDYDLEKKGIIQTNKQAHPEANWFEGDWLKTIKSNYKIFNPALVFFDYTKTVVTTDCHKYLAETMNLCPSGTVLVANLMLSDGHSGKRFEPDLLIEGLGKHLRDGRIWKHWNKVCYNYFSNNTKMGIFSFVLQ